MVEQNFSSQKTSKSRFRIAPVVDRFLAFVFDVVIFTPVFSFLLAGVFRKLELIYFTSPESTEFLVLCGVVFFFVMILTVLTQSFFLLIMGATPGKYFFKLKVISISEEDPELHSSQAFLRSFLWTVEFLFFCFPFLEIFSEFQRRPLHDKAAGTMLVTLKKESDPGPQAVESMFVRQMLLAIGIGVFCWGGVKVVHFYSMAIRGEFKKLDLESSDYLCSSVSRSVKDSDNRLDQALALFLADEISEDCLESEIDFVLWKADDSEKAWAYLAKGILKKSDLDLYEAYLEKACEADEAGAACEIAQHEADPKGHELPPNGQTSMVLRASLQFEAAHYEEAQKLFVALSQKDGYENYSRQGLVKVFWAQNKIEKSRGAYENVIHQMSSGQRRELAAWICHEELDRNCSSQAVSACEDLRLEFSQSQEQIHESFVGLALIREKECRKLSGDNGNRFRDLLENKKDLADFVSAITSDFKDDAEKKRKILSDLAFRKETVRPVFLRRMALQQWASGIKTDEEFEKAIQFLKEKKVRDLSWFKIYQNTVSSMIKMRSEKNLKTISGLPSKEEIAVYHLENLQIQAFYIAQDFHKAWELMSPLSGLSRGPASGDTSDLNLETIQHNLRKKFSKEGK
jgi:uncharacterized RDD family membrane protein YckC